ncbi:MAG: cell division protein FtsL [Candidatus Cloacimonadota bacterium]|nr:MAG: cell division protein FtsL [Candidatus Cloacimonadota bacterium]
MIRRLFFIILTFAAVVLLLLFYVWERAAALQLTLVLAQKEKKLDGIQNKIEKLRLEFLNLTSVMRIEKIAKEKLKMRYPTSKEVRYIMEKR